jgi:hypothetical protein
LRVEENTEAFFFFNQYVCASAIELLVPVNLFMVLAQRMLYFKVASIYLAASCERVGKDE